MKTTLLAVLLAVSSLPSAVMAESGAIVRYFIVTAPTSTNNNSSIQNVQSYVDKRGVVGLIPNDVTVNPAALNMPHVLRGCEIIFGPALVKMWDTIADPSGAFGDESGSRLAWSFDYTNTTPFLASDIYFRLWSSDAANTLRFSGNIATNGTAALTFSPTLRGELWDGNGNKTYHNGETVADHPVNRVIVLIRLGWYVTDMSQVQLDMDYFRNQMTLTNFAAFYMPSTEWGVTNWISSRPFLTAHPANGDGQELVTVEGQRHISITYGLKQSPSLDPGQVVWTTVAARMIDGGSYVNDLVPKSFYKAFEEGINLPGVDRVSKTTTPPVMKVWVGPDSEEPYISK